MFQLAKPKHKLLVALALFVSLAMFAASCGSDDDDTSTGDPSSSDVVTGDTEAPSGDGDGGADSGGEITTTTTEPPLVATGEGCTADRQGGSITMGMFSETAGLDPTVSSGSGVTGMIELMTIYDILIRYDKATGEYVPHLAESLESNDDFTVWTLKLRPNVTFSNGDPLDADAVIASMDRWANLDAAVGQRNQSTAFVSFISNMEATDDLTVVFTLDEPWGTFPYTLADEPGMIVNVNAIPLHEEGEDAGKPNIPAFNRNPVGGGAGPYEVVRFAPGEEIVVRARNDYWGGPVCIEEITFVRVPGAAATYDAWQTGELDVAYLREPKVNAEARENGDDNAIIFLQNTGGVLLMNNGVRGSETPTSDVRLREAIFLALDADVLNDRANEGTGLQTKSLLDGRSQFYDPDLFPEFPTDLDRARELVEEVKAEGNWDGTIRLNCHNAPSRIDWALAAEALLENVGFDVEVLNDGTIQDLIGAVIINADYDLGCWGFNLSDETPYIPVLQHTCTSRSNRTGYCDERMDAAVAQLRAANTNPDIQAALAEIWAIWQETIPSASVETIEEYVLFRDNIRGAIGTQTGGILFHDAYIE